MWRAFGFVVIILALSHFMTAAFVAFERAAVATFGALEAAAIMSQKNMIDLSE